MFGEIIALLTTLSWSLGIIPFTEAAKRLGASALNQYRLLLAWMVITCILLATHSFQVSFLFSQPQSKHFLYLGVSGIIGFSIGDYFSITSFKILGPKLGSLYTSFAPGAALLTGYVLLGQEVNAIGLMGMCITIGGVIWLTLSRKDKKASEDAGFERNKKGVVFGVIGAFCQGIGLVLSKMGLDSYPEHHLETLHAVWIRLLFAFSAAFLISLLTGHLMSNSKPIFSNHKNGLPFMLLGTLFGPVMGVSLSLLAIQHLEVAVAQTIFALLPMVVLPINYFYYKEKITAQSLVACLIAIFGVVMLIWRNAILVWIS
ncbi:MAG: DMT family transporter [bacterium]|nr:DMT family transporter [bacterium]